LVVEVNVQTRALMVRLARHAQRIGLATVKSRDGRARRFVAWGREIEYVVLETGAVRASALVDEQVMATSTKSVEWMQRLMSKARADQLSRTGTPATARFVRRAKPLAPVRHAPVGRVPTAVDRRGTATRGRRPS
jgi:hypothetical protein